MGELPGSSDSWRGPLKLAGAMALLLAGSMALAAGAANVGTTALIRVGVVPAMADQVAVGLAALIPPLLLYGVLRSVGAPGRFHRYAALGISVAGAGIIVGILSPALVLDRIAAGLYSVGFLFGLVALTGAVLAEDASNSANPSFRRSTVRTDRVTPADGGADDEDLSFPLDEEE